MADGSKTKDKLQMLSCDVATHNLDCSGVQYTSAASPLPLLQLTIGDTVIKAHTAADKGNTVRLIGHLSALVSMRTLERTGGRLTAPLATVLAFIRARHVHGG